MDLPVMPPVKPMLAKATKTLPSGDLLYEPKWDGFRCIVFRDGDEVELGSRNERPLTRYFPEVLDAVRRELPPRCVLDGELVVPRGSGGLDWDALTQRIHPAATRVAKLARETPAALVVFDVLALGDTDHRSTPLGERRAILASAFADTRPPIYLTPATTDADKARDWFSRFEGAGLDGVLAKPLDLPYREDERVMFKVKHERTADCVVAGFRWHKNAEVVGSLLLGLYDDDGVLHHVGVAASFPMQRRLELVDEIAPLRTDALETHPWRHWAAPDPASGRMPGAVSRWNAKKDLSWEPLRPERVVEVRYDQLEGDRFRHTAHFRRWRDDRDPRSCTYDQLEAVPPRELGFIFSR